jgi:hypothetical protein
MNSIDCPKCGATNQLLNPAVVSVVCPYCDNILIIDKAGIRLTGKQSRLSEGFSRLFRNATGQMFNRNFIVLGRVRYDFGRGFWDEWYIQWEDGSTAWVTEDNHQFSLQEEVQNEGLNIPSTLGERFSVNGVDFQVVEIGEAICKGIEGSLPKDILPDETYIYIDGTSLDGTMSVGLEFDEGNEPPRIYLGRWILHGELKMEENDYAW